MNQDSISVVERVKAHKPRFFRKLRGIGIAFGAIGGAILAAPVALPAAITAVAGI